MRVVPPQSLMGWQGAQCLAGLADVTLGPEGIGLVGVPAPTRTHGVGLRGLPGHRGAGLGLVGFEVRRRKNLEQVVGGVAATVARERGGGTAAVQATSWTPCPRSSSAVTQNFSLYCMPGAVARQLRALSAARRWGVAGASGARGMVRGFGRLRGAGEGGGRAPGARGGGGGGRCSARLGSGGARLGWARRGSSERSVSASPPPACRPRTV